ncbi:MAG: hypothetical protein PHV99_02930 [Candidatus Pacebacteria bacterium]|nr:hypothetical protein [Candidatus Paceibacterota bacterium]
MRMRLFSLVLIGISTLLPVFSVQADTSTFETLTTNLMPGSRGMQVIVLQKILNRDPETRITSAGLGSPGNETDMFGPLTKAAVIRFQEKYAQEILVPAGLARGNGYVGSYTRNKLNSLSSSVVKANSLTAQATTTAVAAGMDFLVRDTERTDIYAGDKKLEATQNRFYAAINAAILAANASQSTATITPPTITMADVPSVTIGMLAPQFGTPGTKVSLKGSGISSKSVVYFGNTYLVRTVNVNIFGDFSFIIPSIPPGRYDVAVRTGDTVSNTTIFVITDPKNPPVHIERVSPVALSYGGTLTITGSGFLPKGNVVMTKYQKFLDVPSPDSTTLTVEVAPERLRASAKVGNGTRSIPMFLYVVNDYGFSDTEKSFTMNL